MEEEKECIALQLSCNYYNFLSSYIYPFGNRPSSLGGVD